MRYCITHGTKLNRYEVVSDLSDCVIVYSKPPADMDKDGWEWTLSLPEPSEDELALMDMNAEVLEADFIGE